MTIKTNLEVLTCLSFHFCILFVVVVTKSAGDGGDEEVVAGETSGAGGS